MAPHYHALHYRKGPHSPLYCSSCSCCCCSCSSRLKASASSRAGADAGAGGGCGAARAAQQALQERPVAARCRQCVAESAGRDSEQGSGRAVAGNGQQTSRLIEWSVANRRGQRREGRMGGARGGGNSPRLSSLFSSRRPASSRSSNASQRPGASGRRRCGLCRAASAGAE